MVAALLVFLALAFVQSANGQTETQETGLAAVRLAHFSPDAPLLDLLVDGRLRLRDLNFTGLSSYLVIPAGEHELRIQPHRAPNQGDSTNVQAPEPFVISVTLEPGKYYTLVASGFFDPPPTQEQLGSLELSMTANTVATITGPRGYSNTATETATLSELFPGVYTVRAGKEGYKTASYEVEVRPNETAFLSIALQANSEGEPSEELPQVVGGNANLGLEWRKVQLQLYEDELTGFPPPGSAFVRVIHASPITPAVTVALARRGQNDEENNEPIITELTYPNEADYVPVEAGRVSFRLQGATGGQTLTELENLELHSGTIYTFYIVATRDDSFVSLIPTVDALLTGQP